MSTCWRYIARPSTKVNTLAAAHGVQVMPSSGTRTVATSQGAAAATAMMEPVRITDPRCQAT